MTDTRWHFGGPYGYEFDCQIIPPVGSGLSSRLESQASVFLGQLETYRRLSNLQTLTHYAQDSAGNFYEYGFVMGRPYAVIRVVGTTSTSRMDEYKPAIAFIPASSGTGSTFTFNGTAHLVNAADVRASSLISQYNRVSPLAADTLFASASTRIFYKGHGFVPVGASHGRMGMVVGDSTGEKGLSDQTSGALIIVTDNPDDTCSIYRAGLPTYRMWKITGSSIYPNVDMGEPISSVPGGNAIAPCVGSPYILVGDYPFSDTARVYRYAAAPGHDVGELIASYTKATSQNVDLAAYTNATVTGPSITATTVYSGTEEIRRWPLGTTLNLPSVPADDPIPLSGSITRSCTASGEMTYTTPIQQPVVGGSPGAKAISGEITSHISQTATLNYCGTPLTAEESMTHSLTFSSANTMSVAAQNGDGTYSGSETAEGEDHWRLDTQRKALTLCFADAAFRVAVVLEKTTTLSYARDRALSASGSFSHIITVQDWPAPSAGTVPGPYTVSWFAQQVMGTPSESDMAGDPYPQNISTTASLDQTQTEHERRDVVIYRSGVEVLRQTYYEATASTWGSDDRLYSADPIRAAAGSTEPISESLGTTIAVNFRTVPLLQIDMESITQDRAIATCDANGVYVDVEWSSPTPGRLFVTHDGQDWAAQSGVTLGAISTGNKMFRV